MNLKLVYFYTRTGIQLYFDSSFLRLIMFLIDINQCILRHLVLELYFKKENEKNGKEILADSDFAWLQIDGLFVMIW